MSKLIKKQNNLQKAQARLDKVSKRSKQFQIDFVRGKEKSCGANNASQLVKDIQFY